MAGDDGRVVSNFIVQALSNKPLTMYGDGSQTRSFCYVADLIRGMLAVMQSSEAGPINLGNPKEFTMLELAKKIITKTNSQSEIIFEPLPVDDPRQRQPDISKANKILNWNPLIQLDRGLDLTIDYFRTCK